jgi:DNA-binding NtrC family response regulator
LPIKKRNELFYLKGKKVTSLSTDQKVPNKKAILVVDDEAGPRESLRMVLKPLYEVHTASDGQEALRLIQNKDIDVVTLDLNMPGLSGIEVLKEIKKLRPETEVIVITGYGTLNNAQEAIRFGAGDLISKPFDVAEIISIMARSFERGSYTLEINSLIERIRSLQPSKP